MSPTENTVPSSTVIDVLPTTLLESFTCVTAFWLNAVAEKHAETFRVLPQAPAVLAAHSPTAAEPPDE